MSSLIGNQSFFRTKLMTKCFQILSLKQILFIKSFLILEQQFREHFRAKWSLWAAVGAGCLVGVSGLLLMQRLSLRVDHSVCVASSGAGSNVSKELASLHSTLKELRQEIQELRAKPLLKYVKNIMIF